MPTVMHSNRRSQPLRRALLLAAAGLLPVATLVWLACRPAAPDKPAATASATAPIQIVLSGPKEAAHSVLLCLQAIHAAHTRHDRAAVSQYMDQLDTAAASDVILQRCHTANPLLREKPDKILRNFTQGWVAVVGYYADGLHPEQLKTVGSTTGAQRIEVLAAATSANGDATLRLECVRGDDGQWRVARVDFAPRPVPAPATAPTTAPAP